MSEAGKETTEPDNVNVGLIATVTIVGALLVVSIAAALTALVRSESAVWSDEIGSHANLGAVDRLKAEQRAKLEGAPTWSDRAAGRVSVPIDRAMALVQSDIQKNPYLATPLPPKPKEIAADAGVPAAASPDGGAALPAPSAAPAAPVPSAGALAVPAAPSAGAPGGEK